MEKVRIDAQRLRAVAEHASGVRGKKMWFLFTTDGKKLVKEGDPPAHGPNDLLIGAETRETGSRAAVEYARIGHHKNAKHALDLLNVKGRGPADAVFWTESAVEKFLIPYYAAVSGPNAAKAVAKILKVFHEGPPGGAANKVFALIHLPTSEYTDGAVSGLFALVEGTGAEGEPTVELVSVDAWEPKTEGG